MTLVETVMDSITQRQCVVLASSGTDGFLGMRHVAVPLRLQIQHILSEGRDVSIDFTGVSATQSFVDELVGHIILNEGPEVLRRIVFKNCSDDTRAMLRFVTADRASQYVRAHSHY